MMNMIYNELNDAYDEEMAKELAECIYVYESLLQVWYSRMIDR